MNQNKQPKCVTKEPDFRGLKVYCQRKNEKGFFVEILEATVKLLDYASKNWDRPQLFHLCISAPKDCTLKRLSSELRRWSRQRDKANRRHVDTPVLYLAAIETRPRKKQRHLHLAVFTTGNSVFDVYALKQRLRKFSETDTEVALYQRRFDCLALALDESTGEIKLTKRGDFARQGSMYYHDLRKEYDDAFQRISYLAKVYSKSASPEWSSSLVPKRSRRADQTEE